MDWAQVFTIIGAVTGLFVLQSFWIGRMFDQINGRLGRIEDRLDRIEATLIDHGERITRLEERVAS